MGTIEEQVRLALHGVSKPLNVKTVFHTLSAQHYILWLEGHDQVLQRLWSPQGYQTFCNFLDMVINAHSSPVALGVQPMGSAEPLHQPAAAPVLPEELPLPPNTAFHQGCTPGSSVQLQSEDTLNHCRHLNAKVCRNKQGGLKQDPLIMECSGCHGLLGAKQLIKEACDAAWAKGQREHPDVFTTAPPVTSEELQAYTWHHPADDTFPHSRRGLLMPHALCSPAENEKRSLVATYFLLKSNSHEHKAASCLKTKTPGQACRFRMPHPVHDASGIFCEWGPQDGKENRPAAGSAGAAPIERMKMAFDQYVADMANTLQSTTDQMAADKLTLHVAYKRATADVWIGLHSIWLNFAIAANNNIQYVLTNDISFYITAYASKNSKEEPMSLSAAVVAVDRACERQREAGQPAPGMRSLLCSAVFGHTKAETVGAQRAAYFLLGRPAFPCSHEWSNIGVHSVLNMLLGLPQSQSITRKGPAQMIALNYAERPDQCGAIDMNRKCILTFGACCAVIPRPREGSTRVFYNLRETHPSFETHVVVLEPVEKLPVSWHRGMPDRRKLGDDEEPHPDPAIEEKRECYASTALALAMPHRKLSDILIPGTDLAHFKDNVKWWPHFLHWERQPAAWDPRGLLWLKHVQQTRLSAFSKDLAGISGDGLEGDWRARMLDEENHNEAPSDNVPEEIIAAMLQDVAQHTGANAKAATLLDELRRTGALVSEYDLPEIKERTYQRPTAAQVRCTTRHNVHLVEHHPHTE